MLRLARRMQAAQHDNPPFFKHIMELLFLITKEKFK